MISIIFISVFEYSRTVKILISIEMHNKHNILQVMFYVPCLPTARQLLAVFFPALKNVKFLANYLQSHF